MCIRDSASAALIDHAATMDFGESYMPHFGALYDIRHTVAGLFFLIGLAVSLPRALDSWASMRYQPLLAAVSYSAVGCLAWITGSNLSSLGHGYVLGGALVAAGMLSLALTRLAVFSATSPNRLLADIAGWLAASRIRGFVLGAAIAFYWILLRPTLYEVLWFAALYEYIALLVLMLMVSMYLVKRMRRAGIAPQDAQPVRADWSHHRQTLETKADPRSELTSALRQRFVDYGEWKPLWTYLMGLLYRSDASLDSMRTVCRSLRNSVASSSVVRVPGRNRWSRSRRIAALTESLNSAERALSSSETSLRPIHEDALREAAAPFVESGAEPEALAVALVAAHCQRGDDLEWAIDRWFSLLDAPGPSSGWLKPPWARSRAGLRDRGWRMDLVDSAIGCLFGDANQRAAASMESAG